MGEMEEGSLRLRDCGGREGVVSMLAKEEPKSNKVKDGIVL